VLAIPVFAQAIPEKRVALVIGASRYQHIAPLDNPANDARLVAGALRASGFEVSELIDPADLASFGRAVQAFRAKAATADAAVIYFAGHGVEVGGQNWLLPTSVKAEAPEDLEFQAVRSGQLADAVRGARGVRLVILDACRNNPFAAQRGFNAGGRSVGARGLARSDDAGNVVVLMATAPGQTAADGRGQANSPFAQALASVMQTPGTRLSVLPTLVSERVRSATGAVQRPDQSGIWDSPDWAFVAASNGQQAVISRPTFSAATWGVTEQDLSKFYAPQVLDKVRIETRLAALRAAAASQDPYAQVILGMGYEAGRGVTKNEAEAVRLYRASAEAGNTRGMYELGASIYNATAGALDGELNLGWVRAAADRDNILALHLLANHFGYFGTSQTQASLRESAKLLQKLVTLGDPEATLSLALAYRDGRGVEKNQSETLRLLRQADSLSNGRATMFLAVFYAEGRGVTKSETEAFGLYLRAANLGDAEGQLLTGRGYETGKGIPQNPTEARKWYRAYLEPSLFDGSYEYNHDVGALVEDTATPLAIEVGMAELLRRVDRNSPSALTYLAEYRDKGIGGPRNPKEALRLARAALAATPQESDRITAQALVTKLTREGVR
jgi:uncharacterized protein